MFSFLVARVKPAADYDFFVFNGKVPVVVEYRGVPYEVTRGQRFGVRPSSNKKQIRMIFENEPSRVFTITLDTARKLAKHVAPEGK